MILTGLVCFDLLVLIVSAKKGFFIGQCYMAAKWVFRHPVWMYL